MRKLLLLLVLIFSFSFLKAQSVIQITQPYYFLKGVKVKDSIRSTIYFQNPNDTLATKRQIRGDFSQYRKLNNHDSLSTLDEKDYNSLTGKPNLNLKADTSTVNQQIRNILYSLPQSFEITVTIAGISQINLPFTLKSTALVWYNGSIISKNLWTGTNTTTLTLFLDTKQKDLFIIQNQ